MLHPLKRIGAKGEGRFERIGWDEALDTIAAKFKAIAAEDPQGILPCSYAGTMGLAQYASMDRRFFRKLGASLLDRTLCSSAGKAGMKITLGAAVGMDPERFDEAKLILIWGSNPIVANLHLWSRVRRQSARIRARAPGRGGGAVGVVEKAFARWPQRQRSHVAGDRGHGRGGDVLRLPGRGRGRRLSRSCERFDSPRELFARLDCAAPVS